MGKERRGRAAAPKEAPRPTNGVPAALLGTLLVLVSAAAWAGRSPLLHSIAEGRCHFLVRLLFFVLLEGALTPIVSWSLLQPARELTRRLPGAAASQQAFSSLAPTEQEQEQNDPSLAWPLEHHGELPAGWLDIARRGGSKQPFFLNHVSGGARCKHAALRVGSAIATVLLIGLMATLLDRQPLAAIGLHADGFASGLALGGLTGTTCVAVLFLAEWQLGWLHVCGYCEVVAPGERLSHCLLWDVAFHIGVSVIEEVSLRGWLLHNLAAAASAHLGLGVPTAMAVAIAGESAIFASLHLGSPGASALSLLNLSVGGVAAALNVAVSGSLAFALGWHFCWNITMGNVLGLSTSGIPISATLVSVVPHPAKAHLHGGRFGPEASPLAPMAYLLGVGMLAAFYGTDELWALAGRDAGRASG